MGETELLTVPPSVLMDRESHPQPCCCEAGPALLRFCCRPPQSTLSARFHGRVLPFVQSVTYSTGTPRCLLGAHWTGHEGPRENTNQLSFLRSAQWGEGGSSAYLEPCRVSSAHRGKPQELWGQETFERDLEGWIAIAQAVTSRGSSM